MSCKPSNFPNGIDAGACLQADINAIMLLPDVSVEVTSNYVQRAQDDTLWCTGTLEITLLDPTVAIKSLTVRSLTATVTLTPAAGTTETTTLTVAQSQRMGPRATGWFNL